MSYASTSRSLVNATLVALGLAGCLEPRVSDDVVEPNLILKKGSMVPSIYDGKDAERLTANDGVAGTIPLLSGFVNGKQVRFWNFGPAPTHAAPMFVITRNGVATSHPFIFDTIPGDAAYSPFWVVYQAEVTDQYDDEIIPSVEALTEAVRRGLVNGPKSMPINANLPAVGPDVLLDAGDGTTIAPTGTFYYEGQQGKYFNFGMSALPDRSTVPTMNLYELRREGGDPVSEPERGVDLDGDGDLNDTNDVFPHAISDACPQTAMPGDCYSPRCQVVQITVPAGTSLIDTTKMEDQSSVTNASSLFSGAQPTAIVLGIKPTTRIFNCAQQQTKGGL